MTSPIIHREFCQHLPDGTPDPQWVAMRCGKWTASHAGTIMSKIGERGGMTLGLQDLVKSVAWGRVYGADNEPRYQSPAMQRGNAMEAEARDWYAFTSDALIDEAGFVEHADIPQVGWSPDGLMAADTAGIEIKCLLHKAWMDVKRTGKVPSEYRWQCRWAMWAGQLDALDFIAYHPQAGGIVIPCEVTDPEKQQMVERVELLEARVVEWVNILRKAA